MNVMIIEELNDTKESIEKVLEMVKGQVKDSSGRVFDSIINGEKEIPGTADILNNKDFALFCKNFGYLVIDYSFDFIDEALEVLHKKAIQDISQERSNSGLH